MSVCVLRVGVGIGVSIGVRVSGLDYLTVQQTVIWARVVLVPRHTQGRARIRARARASTSTGSRTASTSATATATAFTDVVVAAVHYRANERKATRGIATNATTTTATTITMITTAAIGRLDHQENKD